MIFFIAVPILVMLHWVLEEFIDYLAGLANTFGTISHYQLIKLFKFSMRMKVKITQHDSLLMNN